MTIEEQNPVTQHKPILLIFYKNVRGDSHNISDTLKKLIMHAFPACMHAFPACMHTYRSNACWRIYRRLESDLRIFSFKLIPHFIN